MKYVQEQEEWDRFVLDNLGENAVLVNVSKSSSDRRVYRVNNTMVEIHRSIPPSIRDRNNSLEDEYLIMQRLSSVAEVPAVRRYKRTGDWEQLEMDLIPELVGYDGTFGRPRETFKDFWDIVRVMIRMNRLGCSHGNLHWSNVGRNVVGGISIFGFEQATLTSPWRCAMRDILGVGTSEKNGVFPLLDRLPHVWGKAIGFLRRGMARFAKEFIKHLSRGGPSATQPVRPTKPAYIQRATLRNDPALETLAEAWSVASHSRVSGGSYAYYSLDVSGINFPGTRPWIMRWERIRKNVDFRGKSMLELGCNMGLLSIHAKLSGAIRCLGIDSDADSLQAARLASRAFGTDVEYRHVNLDGSASWEEELKGFDIVSALSVVHWIRDKERAWSFISKHKEVIYEGHESEQEAKSNLRKAGFTQIVSLGRSERIRQVFYASQV